MRVAIRNAVLPRIQRAERIVVIGHVAPDGDCVGSLLAVGQALDVLSKQAFLVCADPLPVRYALLPGYELVRTEPPADCDLLISVDCSDIQRMGPAYRPAAFARVPLINIDHHKTNVHFGTVNWVDTGAAATAEMIYELVEEMAVPITPQVATCLLAGIVTDTRGFRTSNTTVVTMSIATALMRSGAPLTRITEELLDRRPLSVIRLWGAALSTLRRDDRIVWASVTPEMRRRAGMPDSDDTDGLANFLVSADEAEVGVVFNELDEGRVDVGFRSVPRVDVSDVAFKLGGGGHPQAAGCTLTGTLDDVERHVLRALKAALYAPTGQG